MIFDDGFAALFDLGTDTLAYTDATAQQAAREAATVAMQASLTLAAGVASADLAAASLGTPDGLLAAVDAAERMARLRAAIGMLG